MLRSILTVKLVILPVVLLFSTLALAQFRTVTVQNANSNPVPTTVQNMPPVTVSGPVDANIVNQPTVKVDGGVAVNGTVNTNATIVNVPTVRVDGGVAVAGTISTNATIVNEPLVKVDGGVAVNGTVDTNTTIVNEPLVKVDGAVAIAGTVSTNTTIVNVPSVKVDGGVAVTNTPTVNINGMVPVTIAGTPAVSVANLPLGTAGPLNTTVLLVKNLDNAAQQPLQVPFTCTTGQNGNCTSSFNIPAGKIFVAEYVQTTSHEPPSVNALYYRLQTTSGGQTVSYFYDSGSQIVGQGLKMRTSEHMVRIYADAGSTIFLSGFADLNGNPNGLDVSVTVSGHLVNAP